MVTSYPDENAWLRAQLLEQQNTLRQMAEYNRQLSLNGWRRMPAKSTG